MCDRNEDQLAYCKSQCGFLKFLVAPLFTVMGEQWKDNEALGGVLERNIVENVEAWEVKLGRTRRTR
jgi:hypothetical protein